MAGFGLGGCIPVDYALVGEFTPRRQRGRVLTAMDGWWPVGAALCGFVSAWLVAAFADWRLTMLVMVLPALLVFWVRRSVPESPLFLIRTGRRDEAARVIDGLVEATGAEPRAYSLPEPQTVPRLSAGSAWQQLRGVWQFNWKITAAAWALFMSILLVYYLSLTWMPRILIGAGFAEYKAFLTTAGMAAVGLLGVIAAALLVERVGRKWLLAITGPLSALILVVVAFVVDVPTAAVFWLLVFGFVVQVAIPVLYTYVSELYPTELRGSGFGWASTFSRLGAGFGPLIFANYFWPQLGLATSFALAGGLVVLSVLWMAFFSPETRQRRLE
jgi:putative MFS transporter